MSTSALALIESITAVEFFKPGASASIIESLKLEARAVASTLDVSKASDRETMRSLAAKLAKTKTKLDNVGKDLVSGWKQQAKVVDAERASVWDEVEALQKEVRQPLTDWENAEKDRIAAHEERIRELEATTTEAPLRWQTLSIEAMTDRIGEITADARDWQEFKSRGELGQRNAIAAIQAAILQRETYDREQAELAVLRAEAAEREQKERDERIASAAKAEAEAAAKRREEEVARTAEAERQRMAAEQAASETRAKQAEAELVRAEERRAAEAKAAEAAQVRAIEDERLRVASETARAKAEAEAREKDKAHKAEVHSAALQALVEAGLAHNDAKTAITAIAKGLVPNVKVAY